MKEDASFISGTTFISLDSVLLFHSFFLYSRFFGDNLIFFPIVFRCFEVILFVNHFYINDAVLYDIFVKLLPSKQRYFFMTIVTSGIYVAVFDF